MRGRLGVCMDAHVFCDHTKQMLCGNEMAERLSWISWVAAYQDGVLLLSPPLHVWPRIKKTSSAVSQSVEGGLRTHIYRFSPLESAVNEPRPIQSRCGLSSRELSWEKALCISMYTMTPFHICSSLWMWLLCIKGCASHGPNLLAEGAEDFHFFLFTIEPFSAVCASMFTVKLEKVGPRAPQPDGLTIRSTVVQSENS